MVIKTLTLYELSSRYNHCANQWPKQYALTVGGPLVVEDFKKVKTFF